MQFFKKYWPVVVLFFILTIILYLNYTPGTYLTGWDTLHPEFDFGSNFQRLFYGVWREEQGLGAIAGHSHISDLPRVFILWFLHFFFPLNLLRYLYIFLCLSAGVLGVYFLINYIFKSQKSSRLIAFLAASFYLFNLSTVQQFFVPFEMFSTQYGLLPWIVLYSLKFLERGGKKNLLIFGLFTLFAAPQAYAAHLWYAFFGTYLLFLIFYYFIFGKGRVLLKKVIALIVLTLVINSFWLLPNLYYLATSSKANIESKQNRIFTQEYRLRNRENGYLKDVALVRGFYLNWTINDPSRNVTTYLMESWREHLKNPFILSLGYLFFGGVLTGLIYAVKRKNKLFLAFIPLFAVPFIFLMNHTFPFNLFFDLLLRFSILEESLRFVFTKFSILLIFAYALYFSLFVYLIVEILKKTKVLFSVALFLSLVLYCLPVFQGQLISDKMRITIPDEYFWFWNYMKGQNEAVVLSLPIYNFAGWQYYDWGYQGAGFIWFGLKQPILDRDFDRWSVANEQAYRELRHALYSRRSDLFEWALDKFNIGYIVLDKNITTADIKNRRQKVYERETAELLTTLKSEGKIVEDSVFGNLVLYRIPKKREFVQTKTIKNFVLPYYRWGNYDYMYLKNGDYLIHDDPNSFYYPFRDILSIDEKLKQNVLEFDKKTDSYFLTNTNSSRPYIHIPNYLETEEIIFGNVFIKGGAQGYSEILFEPLLPENLAISLKTTILLAGKDDVSFNGQKLKMSDKVREDQEPLYLGQAFIYTKLDNLINDKRVEFGLRYGVLDKESRLIYSKIPLQRIVFEADEIYDLNKTNALLKLIEEDSQRSVYLKTKNQQTGIYLEMNDMPHNVGYILAVSAVNVEGLPLRVCLKNYYSSLCSLYDELSRSKQLKTDYFLVPPSDDGIGYGLSLDNISYGNYETANEIKSIEIIPLPYNFLSQIYFYSDKRPKEQKVIVLNQSFHPAWQAYLGKNKLKDHMLVNNWANGWILPENYSGEKVVFVFWPQLLEFFGFLILAAIGFLMFKWGPNR